MRDAVLLRRLRGRKLEVRVLRHLSVLDGEDGVATHLHHARRLTHRLRTAAPLVGEDDLRSIIAEDRRMPERKVRVRPRVETDRFLRVRDVDDESVAGARTSE